MQCNVPRIYHFIILMMGGGGIPEWVKNKMKGIDCLAFVALYSWPMIEFKVKVGK